MMKCLVIGISTFVLTATALAAPEGTPLNLDEVKKESTQDEKSSAEMKLLDISQPPPESAHSKKIVREQQYFYRYRTAMGPRLGLVLDAKKLAERKAPPGILGFFYLLPSISARHYEVGADLQSNSTGTLNGAARWIYNATEGFRPFTKAGLSILVEPEKALINLIDYHQYALRLGAGIEDTLKDPTSLRWDIEATIGFKGFTANVVFGYSWAW